METTKDDVAVTDQASETGSTIAGSLLDDAGQPIASGTISTETGQPIIKATPPFPQQMTLREFKQLRAKYFTVRHKRMEPCGHRLDQINEPRNNCEFCWFAFFQTHGELVQTVDRAIQEQGLDFVERLRGVKFRKMFLRFMSTMAMFQKEIEAAKAKEKDGQAGTDQGSEGFGESLGQTVREQGDNYIDGQTSGPVAANLPDAITLA